MNIQIDPEEIRSRLEAWAMSRQELAERVGVPVKAVMEWEQGIVPVPLGKVGAVRKALDMGSETQPEFGHAALLRRLGQLAKQRREELGMGRPAFAKEIGLGSDRTLVQFEFGRTLPSGASQRKIEKGLDWKLGVIEEVMRMVDRKAADIPMEILDAQDSLYLASRGGIDPSNPRPLRYVSSEDLLEEIRLRLESAAPPPRLYGKPKADVKDMYGLAASTNVEHLEDDDDSK
jgi:DNA-binding transcriptional regulator YiaG